MLQIKELIIKNYRQFNSKNLQLKSGINIVYGDNEKGKSTTISSILSLFYADSSTNAKTILDFVQSWGITEKPALSASLNVNGKGVLLYKDFEKKKSKLDFEGNAIEDIRKINVEISKILGIGSPEIYKSVAIFKGGELSEVSQNGKLKESLTGISTGEDTNALKALKNIRKSIDEISKGIERYVKSPGKLKLLRDELGQKRSELNEMKNRQNLYVQSLRQYQVAKESLEVINHELQELDEILDKNKKYNVSKLEVEKMTKEIGTIHVQLEEITGLTTKLENIINSNSRIFPEGVDIQSFDEKYSEFEDRIKVNEQKINSIKSEISSLNKSIILKKDESTKSSNGNKKFLNIFLGIISSLAVFSIPFYPSILIYLVGVSILALVILFYNLFYTNQYESRPISDEESDYRKKLEEVEDLLKVNSEESLKIENERNEFLEKSKIKDKEEFLALKKKFSDNEAEIKSLREVIFNKVKSNKFEDVEELISSLKENERNLLISKNEVTVTVLEKLKPFEISGERYAVLEKKQSKLLNDKKSIEEEFISSKERTKNLNIDHSEVSAVEERIFELESEESFWTRKLISLETAENFLKIAIKSTTKGASAKIESELKKYLPIITLGRYSEVKVLDDFSIQIFSNEKNDYIDPEGSLSSGTIEQIYFLAKIAYLNLISDEQYPPILLDDPFLTFDKDRTRMSFDILREISKNNQIIFFTCHEQYLQYADNVIALT